MAGIDWEKGQITPPKQTSAQEGATDWEKGVIQKPAGFLRKAGDLGLSLLKGAVAIPEAAVGLADIPTGGRVGKFLENEGGAIGFRPKQAKEVISGWQSDDLRSKSQAFQNADGVIDKAATAISNPSLVANAVAESLPLMGAGGVLARGLMAVAPGVGAVGAGAIGEGVMGAGSAAEQMRQETTDGTLTAKQSALAGLSGAATAGFGALGGKVAQKLGIGDVDTMIAKGSINAGSVPGKGFIRRGAEGTLSEGLLEELPQSLSEQAIQNIGLDKPIAEGMADAAVMGTLAGAAMGGGAGVLSGFGQEPQQAAPGQPPAPAGTQPAAPTDRGFNPQALQAEQNARLDALASEEAGIPSVAQTTPPDGAAALAAQRAQAEQARLAQMEASRSEPSPDDEIFQSTGADVASVRPSQAMGLDPAAGPMSAAAALAVDGGATARVQAEQALNAAAEAAPKTKTLDEASPEERAAYDAATFDPARTKQGVTDRRKAAIEGLLERAALQSEGQTLVQEDAIDPPFELGGQKNGQPDAAGGKPGNAGADTGLADAGRAAPDAARVPGTASADTAGQPQRFAALSGLEPMAKATPGQKVKSLKEFMAKKKAEREAPNVQDQTPGTAGAQTQAAADQAPQAVGGQPAGAAAGVPNEGSGYAVEAAGVAEKAATPIVEHTTGKGKVLRGVVRNDMTLDQAKEYDPYAFKKDGGVFIREQHLDKLTANTEPTNGTQAPEAQQTKAQGSQAPAAAAAVTDDLGAQWSRMTTVERQALATRAGVKGVAAKNLATRAWDAMDPIQRDRLRKGFEPVKAGGAAEQVGQAANEAATSPDNDLPEPTQAQKEAGNYKKGHVQFDGLDLTVENPAGSTRSGVDPNGKPWEVTMTAHYGYHKRTMGADGDQVDVYLADNPVTGSPVFVFDQFNADGSFDEHKAVAGVATEAEAKAIYDAHFSDGSGPKRRRTIKSMMPSEFKAWAMSDAAKQPLAPAFSDGQQLAASDMLVYFDQVIAGSKKGERVVNPRFLIGEVDAETAEEIALYISGYDGQQRRLRVSGRTLKHIHESRPAIAREITEQLPGMFSRPDEVLPDPRHINKRALLVKERKADAGQSKPKSYVATVEVEIEVQVSDGFIDIVTIMTAPDRSLREARELKKNWPEGQQRTEQAVNFPHPLTPNERVNPVADFPDAQPAEPSVAQSTQAAQADAPKLTQAEAKELMEWQDLGQKDGIKTHILTFYASKADKDANRGRMTVATVTKEADSKNWVVDGTDERLAMLGMAKKKAEEAGMARAVADGFVEPAQPAGATQQPKTVKQGISNARAKKAAEAEAQRAEYFAPGNILKGYGGHDRVLEYTPPDESGRWSVRVQRVVKQGEQWVGAPNERPRWHSTPPEAKELAAGPVDTVPVITREQEKALYDYLREKTEGDTGRFELLAAKFRRSADGAASAGDRKITLEWLQGMADDGDARQQAAAEGEKQAAERAEQAQRASDDKAAKQLAELKAGRSQNPNYQAFLDTLEQADLDAVTKSAQLNVRFMAFVSQRKAEFKKAGGGSAPEAFARFVRDYADKNLASRLRKEAAPSKTPTIDAHNATIVAVREGKATAEQFAASFEAVVAGKEAVLAELGTLTKAQLLREGGPYVQMRYANEKKDAVAEAVYRQIVGEYALGESVTYGMGKGAYEAAVRRMVEATTTDKLARHVDERKAALAEAQAARAAKAAAIENPQTLGDYREAINAKIREGMTRKEAFLSLTPEQRIQYDTLEAEASREKREANKRALKTQVRAAGQATGGEIVATKHTRDGYDLFVVRLSERLSADDYKTVLASAKKLDGWYSAFRGNGAVPGFQFKDRANAEAFLKLAGGDTTDAQAQAEQRRDAFEDDRSQTAVERLRAMADKLEAQASEVENASRKTNTERRARFASAALAGAAEDKAKAQTMRNIADGIAGGRIKFLDEVRTKSQVDMLASIVATAKGNELRAKYPSYADQEKRRGEPATAETADFAEFPNYGAFRSDLATLGRQLLEVDGTKKLGQRLMAVADDVTDAYLEFAKANVREVSQFGRGDALAEFTTKEEAERAIKRSGLVGKAIVLPIKRGQNRVILSPSEAIGRGVWQGDGDKRITLTGDFGAELVEAIGRRGNKGNKLTVPWQFQNAYDRRKALARLGIETPSEFRSALREFIDLKAQATTNRAKAMELQMVGRRADGLDFFPTAAEVADQMVEAADLSPDMAVLEPSAGMGHLADRIREAGAEPDVIELSPERRELLEEKGYHLADVDDFMAMKPRTFFTYGDVFRAPDGTEGVMRGGNSSMGSDRVMLVGEDGRGIGAGFYNRSELVGVRHRGSDSGYDRIIMNPPFSNRRDAEHVRHAYTLLKPGGRIVAIMGEGVFFGQDRKAQEFRDWLESVGGTSEKLPEGSFMDPSLPVNTGVNARMVVIDKPAGNTDSNGDAVFSQGLLAPTAMGPKPTVQAVQALVGKVQAVSKDVLPVSVVGNPSEVPGLQVPAGTQPTGVLTGGRIYLFADNFGTLGEAYATLFHEIFHLGLQRVIPAEDYAALLKKFANGAQVQNFMRQWKSSPEGSQRANTMPSAAYEALATEEALAMVAEELSESGIGTNRMPGLVKKMLSWLADVADRLGFPGAFGNWVRGLTQTQAERFVSDMTRAVLGGARNLAKTQAKYGTMAKEMTQQTRLRSDAQEAELAELFNALQAPRGVKLAQAQRQVSAHPMAEQIRNIEANFMDMLAHLDDAKLVQINC